MMISFAVDLSPEGRVPSIAPRLAGGPVKGHHRIPVISRNYRGSA
jgi:hypothetical protein